MKNRFLFAALILISAIASVKAQSSGANKEIVSLPDGGFVSFQNQTTWTEPRQAFDMRQLPAALTSQTLADSDHTIHRVLRDRSGRVLFGYDLWISGNSIDKQFKVVVRPFVAELVSRFLNEKPSAESPSTFAKWTEPQTLSDGAEFSLDLLINRTTGVKIVDVVKVSFDRSSLGGESPTLRVRDFTAEAVAMEMKDFTLLVNDKLITTSKSKTGSSGALLWLYVPQRGRFIFSLVPRPDYAFMKVGTVSGNKIEFSILGEHFEWLSSAPILHEEGSWNLWVLADPKYLPLMGSDIPPPPQEKGTLEKLSDKYHSLLDPSPPKVQTQHGGLQAAILNRMEKNAAQAKVMFGAADRMENLLPRN
jgi:hypothetical protein